jgi:Smg protein
VGEKVLEIVVLLMSHLRETQGQLDNLEEISDSLKSQGFTDNEISSAYSWVLDQLQTDSQFVYNFSRQTNSSRVLSDKERQHFTTEAVGYLLQLKHLGLLNNTQMELILERGVMVGPSPIDLEQIKIVVGTVLFREPGRPELIRQPAYFSPEDEGLVN